MRVRLSVIVAACLVLACWPLAAGAQPESREAIALQNQIYQLQQQVESLRQQVANGQSGGSSLGGYGYQQQSQQGSSNDMVAQLLSRVNTLDEQMRELRGQVDELQNETQQKLADLNKQIGDLKFQMQNPGAAAGTAPGAPMTPGGPAEQAPPAGPMTSPPPAALGSLPTPPPPARQADRPTPLVPQPSQPAAPAVRRTPEVAMHDGYAALAHHDYMNAEAAARDVLNNYRTSPRAYDAQFLLAQALAGERQYSQAAIAYDDTYNRNRKGGHAAPALLGLASSLAAINEKRAACETLVKLHGEFPRSTNELRSEIAAVRQRAGCQ